MSEHLSFMARAAEAGFDLSPANMARLLGFSIEAIMREPARYGMTFVYVDTGNLFERSREIIEKIIYHPPPQFIRASLP